MTAVTKQALTLAEFLQLPETKPASEYINGEVIQKPMPKGRHSRLQGKLCATINQVTEEQKVAYAELCLILVYGKNEKTAYPAG
ncbi:Uma2 family endonuclease [Leptodesmis sichuanensis]|uniref:Uma2 family endonuclease n=1 Tax=Leptodesmis sichuanensis TaxID=2906798 RepID=UPI0023595D8E|nr:Uma2 family endonuclease [Leptodesmis sichuanensis]